MTAIIVEAKLNYLHLSNEIFSGFIDRRHFTFILAI